MIESDLKEILTRLEQKIDNVTKDVNHLNVTLVRVEAELKGDIKVLNETIIGTKAELKGDLKALDEKADGTKAELKGDIKALDEKVDGLSKRLDTTEFTNRGILIGLIVAILGGFAKLFGLVGNP